jgi:hypothetical protein
LFSFEQSLEQLKLPWSSENTFSVLAKGCTVDEGLAKIREKWTSIPLLCQRQIMIMLANELEADTSLIRPMEELASQIDMSEHADDWLRYFVSSSNGTTFMAQVNVLHQPLFPECISLPDRTSLPRGPGAELEEPAARKSNEERNVPIEGKGRHNPLTHSGMHPCTHANTSSSLLASFLAHFLFLSLSLSMDHEGPT